MGVVRVIWVSDWTVTCGCCGLVPKITWVAPVNPVPVIVTGVPPLVGPELGATDVTTGGYPTTICASTLTVSPGAMTAARTDWGTQVWVLPHPFEKPTE
jgi:hypothetical protein